jgi:ArsR family transcriptional regulator, zinc-responsive transcriptional repressor
MFLPTGGDSMGRPKPAKYAANGKQLLHQVRQAATLLKHVSEPTRLQVISMLSEGEMYVGAMCRELDLGQPAMSHHLMLMRHGGIVDTRRQGQNTFYSLSEKGELLAGIIKGVLA